MTTVKKSITKANKYTKKKGRVNYNNSKILHNFYNQLFKKKDALIMTLFNKNKNSIMSKFLDYIYIELNNKQKIINSINIAKSRTIEDNKDIISNKITSIVNKHLKHSKYVDESIISYIVANKKSKIVIYENIIKGKTYVFDFIIYNDEISITNLDLIVEKMLLVLQLIIAISKNDTRNGQHVTFFLTPFQKKLNLNNNIILGAKNVNSGFTYPYLINGITIIYRKEEFFKVFIHESIHYYGIDKALHKAFNRNINYNNFMNLFNISNKTSVSVGINESLTEFWTFIIDVCVISYNKSIKLTNYIDEFERLYKLELTHIIFQLVKILNYNKLTYSQLLTKSSNKYRENTHSFSYYIVKTLLVYNHEDVLNSNIFDINFSNNLNICFKHDTNSINNFFINLVKYALDKDFLKVVNEVTSVFNNMYNRQNSHSIYKEKVILNNLMMMSNDYNIL